MSLAGSLVGAWTEDGGGLTDAAKERAVQASGLFLATTVSSVTAASIPSLEE